MEKGLCGFIKVITTFLVEWGMNYMCVSQNVEKSFGFFYLFGILLNMASFANITVAFRFFDWFEIVKYLNMFSGFSETWGRKPNVFNNSCELDVLTIFPRIFNVFFN